MKKARFSNGLQGKGFAAALVLSVAAAGLSTYAAYNSAMDKLSGAETTAAEEDEVYLFEQAEDVGKNQTGVPKETTSQTTATQPAEEALIFSNPKTMPLEGEVINPYSGGELVKNETLGVWKTHDGADIAAEQGAAVAACMKGKVTEVNNDPLWGICVVIDHGDGIVGHYRSLAQTVNVKAGQEVKMGEIIGQVGNTAEIECKLASHLHFGITKDGEWIDPIAFIGE